MKAGKLGLQDFVHHAVLSNGSLSFEKARSYIDFVETVAATHVDHLCVSEEDLDLFCLELLFEFLLHSLHTGL